MHWSISIQSDQLDPGRLFFWLLYVQTRARLVYMETIGSYEAKTHLPALLERVQKGERITITKHGVPIAVLAPIEPQPRRSREDAIETMRAFGRGRSLPEGMTLKDMIEEGRRY